MTAAAVLLLPLLLLLALLLLPLLLLPPSLLPQSMQCRRFVNERCMPAPGGPHAASDGKSR
jgi:hypothetical protein